MEVYLFHRHGSTRQAAERHSIYASSVDSFIKVCSNYFFILGGFYALIKSITVERLQEMGGEREMGNDMKEKVQSMDGPSTPVGTAIQLETFFYE